MFLHFDGSIVSLREGLDYLSVLPEQAVFDIPLGRLMTEADFEMSNAVVTTDGTFEVSYLRVDNVFAVFAKNGKSTSVNIDLYLTNSQNLTSSRGLEIHTNVAANSYRFLTLAYATDPAVYWHFSYNYWYATGTDVLPVLKVSPLIQK